MKKFFTIAAAMFASLSMYAALPLTALTADTTAFTSEFWGSTVDKNKVIYNQSNQIMMFSQGNNLSFSGDLMLIGNSSKVSAFVFYISEEKDITVNLGYNNSNATVTLYYMGETTDELTSNNINATGTKTCGSASVTSGFDGGITAKACAAGYYKVHGSLRFGVKNIVLAAPTAADHTKATVTNITVEGQSLAFAADQTSYTIELEFDATTAPTVAAETADDATVVVTQAETVPGAATVVCTSFDQTATATYTINFTKETETPIIRATHATKNTATVKGTIGGTAAKSTQDDGKLGSNGHYFGITLAEGTFLAGDSLVIVATLNGGNTATLFTEQAGENAIASPAFDANTGICSYVLTEDASAIYIVRKSSDCNPTVKMMQVFRPVDDGQPKLNVNPASVDLNVIASETNPSATVTFSGKNLAAGTYGLTVPELAGLTVNPASVTVGEDGKLNATVTISYTSDVEVAAANTSVSLTIGELTKTVAINYSAVLQKQYMSSLNIEQFVLDNGTKGNIKAAFDAAHIEYANIDALDTLNDLEKKDYRNYAFLGLKMKKTDAKLAGWLQAGHTIKVRFGNVGANFLVRAAGQDSTCTADNFANVTTESDKVLTFTAPADMYLEIICNSTKTLVIKQIMIDAEIAPVTLPTPNAFLITVADAENGTVSVTWDDKKYRAPVGATIKVTPAPAEGYLTTSLTYNSTPLYDVETGYVTFIMPAEDVTIVAEFGTSFPTVIEQTAISEKAIKRIENGQLIIIKNGIKYDALGQIVK